MVLTVKTRGDVLVRARFSLARWLTGGPGGSADRWLINLRWVAVIGMLLTSVVGHALVPRLALAPLVGLVASVALVNVGWTIELRRHALPSGRTVPAQILIDVVLLGAMLWLSGGVTNPFACFLTFHTVLAGLLGSLRTTLWALMAVVVVAVLLFWAPPLPLAGARLGGTTMEVLAGVVSVVTFCAITGFLVMLFVRQLDALRAETARSEKLAGLGRVVAAICHELNTPLGTIVIAGKDLGHVGREAGHGEVTDLAATIVEQAQRASHAIGLMRGYVGASERREPVDLATFVPEYAGRELDRVGYAGVRTFRVERAGGAHSGPIDVLVLRAALCQILTNVIVNAVEALRDTAAPAIDISVREERGAAEVTIRDNGRGVSPELAERLGEPFQTTKAQQGGSGLGLYVSSLLVDRMAGRLRLDSTPGRGTEVTLVLPRGAEIGTKDSAPERGRDGTVPALNADPDPAPVTR